MDATLYFVSYVVSLNQWSKPYLDKRNGSEGNSTSRDECGWEIVVRKAWKDGFSDTERKKEYLRIKSCKKKWVMQMAVLVLE